VTLKDGQTISALPDEVVSAVFKHAAHRANVDRVAELIAQLQACERSADFNDLQRRLFGYLYHAEEARGNRRRIVQRLKNGKSLPPDAPDPANGLDPALLATWQFESYVYERIARQLRSVGDGLAWRAFGYDRRMILALSRNESPGMMYGTDGLPYELGRGNCGWRQAGRHVGDH